MAGLHGQSQEGSYGRVARSQDNLQLYGKCGIFPNPPISGHKVYLEAVEKVFGGNVDYAMLVKMYGSVRDKEATYSPAKVISCRAVPIIGRPDAEHISTSFVERSNLTMRMSMRRFARLTNAFSKKVENHISALSLYFMFYNFCRIHQTLRVTPAMEAGITDHVWEIEEIMALLPEPEFGPRGPYEKK